MKLVTFHAYSDDFTSLYRSFKTLFDAVENLYVLSKCGCLENGNVSWEIWKQYISNALALVYFRYF